MKVSILSENVTSILPLLNKILPTHSQIPILGNLLLLADSSGFYIKATDLELGAEVKIPAKIETEGAITVPGKEFIEALSSLPKDKVIIEKVGDMVRVKCRENNISFNTIPKDEFPTLYKAKGEEIARFSKKEFADIFSYLIFSVSQEDTRPQLTGVFVDEKDGKVNLVSTDGYRMSVRTIDAGDKKLTQGLIISVKLISEVISLKSEDAIVLFINKAENQIIFEVGDVILVGRMIEGGFPDYSKAIPKESKTTIEFEREELLSNVRLAQVFARDISNIVNIEITGNTLRMTTRTQGVGEGETSIECQKTGEDNKIAFNIRYLYDVLKVLPEQSVVLKLNSPTEAALFEVKDKEFMHVIMPIQVEG